MIALASAAEALRKRFGAFARAPYVPGKTLLRDALSEALGLSAADAEVLCDSLERSGIIEFIDSPEHGAGFKIHPVALP